MTLIIITWQMVEFHVDDPLELKKASLTLVKAVYLKRYDV